MNRQRKRSVAGFTLIEILVAVSILLLFVGGGAKFFENTTKSWQQNYAKLEIQQSARIAMDAMTNNIRQASAGTVVIDALVVPANSKISFDVTKDTGTKTIMYSLVQEKLNVAVDTMDSASFTNVQELYFAKRNPATIAPAEDPRCIYIRLVLKKQNQTITMESYTHLKNE